MIILVTKPIPNTFNLLLIYTTLKIKIQVCALQTRNVSPIANQMIDKNCFYLQIYTSPLVSVILSLG